MIYTDWHGWKVAEACRYRGICVPEDDALIRTHEVIGVADVRDAVATSRRSLERRFVRAVGRSIGDQIARVHIERAKDLLVRTDLTMPQVAQLSGFTNAKRFSKAFRRSEKTTPTDYRDRDHPRR